MVNRSAGFWQQYGSFLAFAVALTATLGSLYYSEIRHFVPCALCWYQRIFMYPLVFIILTGIIKQDGGLVDYALPLAIVGLGISAYHNLIQYGVLPESGACTVGVPCDVLYVNYFGFVTIPLLALTAFVLITGILILTRRAARLTGE